MRNINIARTYKLTIDGFAKLVGVMILTLALCLSANAQSPPRLVSPSVHSNGDTVFRVRAPQASSVSLVSGGDIPGVPFAGGLALSKGDEGLWSATIPALDPGAYRYAFNIDGVTAPDPGNRLTSESNANAWSLFYVSGSDFMDRQRVPHGAVAEVNYFSTVLNQARRMHVYTPPGYEHGRGRFPVFYLLHGAMDSDDSWTTVGRASFILDNLIAAGDAVPMIVVMPDGHTGPFSMGDSDLPLADFAAEFKADIKPIIERTYRVRNDRANTAIAGLSMGGAQTLDVAMNDLDEYAYIGVFSSGVFSLADGDTWEYQHLDSLSNSQLRRGIELFWFATGRDDFLVDTTQSTVDLLRKHGFDVDYVESSGGHTWINWRQYLRTFAARLFR